MILGLLRHGIAEEAGDATGWRDEPRALTDDGRARMAREARGIARLDLPVARILTSPLTRCEQTARIVAEVNGWDVRIDERLRPGLHADRLLDVLLEHPEDEGVVVCGHQPDMSHVTADLTGADAEFKKGALAVIDLRAMRPRAGVLRGLYAPSVLRRLGAAGSAPPPPPRSG